MAYGFKPLIEDEAPRLQAYGSVLELFVELRGRGASLSGEDLQFLSVWKQKQVPAQVVELIIRGLDAECTSQHKPFPSGLKAVDRRIGKYLKEASAEA